MSIVFSVLVLLTHILLSHVSVSEQCSVLCVKPAPLVKPHAPYLRPSLSSMHTYSNFSRAYAYIRIF